MRSPKTPSKKTSITALNPTILFVLVTALYLILLAVDFVRYGGVVAPSWITAAFAIALGGWIGCRRSEKPRAPRVFAVLAVVSAAAQIALCCVAVPAYPVSAARAKLAQEYPGTSWAYSGTMDMTVRANAFVDKGYVFTQSGDAPQRVFFDPVTGDYFPLTR